MTSSDKLPPISDLTSLPAEAHEKVLALLFEPSPALFELCVPLTSTAPFLSYDLLITEIGQKLYTLVESDDANDLQRLEGILSSHPRLGEKKVESELSRMEQAAMEAASKAQSSSSDISNDRELEQQELRTLNEEYEDAFPGLRYVVFVNGRSRPVIFEDIRRRIARGDIKAERMEAIQAMCDIASDRARKLQQ